MLLRFFPRTGQGGQFYIISDGVAVEVLEVCVDMGFAGGLGVTGLVVGGTRVLG